MLKGGGVNQKEITVSSNLFLVVCVLFKERVVFYLRINAMALSPISACLQLRVPSFWLYVNVPF